MSDELRKPPMTWEEVSVTDRISYCENGVEIGYYKPIGGSYACFYKGELIATRPSRASAMRAIEGVHEACS